MAFSPPVLGLVKKGLQKGGSWAPQDPLPRLCPYNNNNTIYFYSANSTIQFSNALYNSRGNQINIAQIIIFTIIIHKSNQIKCWFLPLLK